MEYVLRFHRINFAVLVRSRAFVVGDFPHDAFSAGNRIPVEVKFQRGTLGRSKESAVRFQGLNITLITVGRSAF